MNRRNFIKTSVTAAVTIPLAGLSTPQGEVETLTGTTPPPEAHRWDHVVYCYEREQGEWVFNQNIQGSFAPEREYMTFEEEDTSAYCGWMDGGKLYFPSLEEAQDFVDIHVRTKDDINLIDSIYDVYYVSREPKETDDDSGEYKETEIKVAHYWFNGDTGRQIHWVANQSEKESKTNWTIIDCA
ncbi:MAG: hypothetical protein H8E05_00510 [Bacteroidetes bacterium]|nr:hypothetical protein [Bacteroidota bacterium]